MNYRESLDYIASTYTLGIKLGLENIGRLMEKLGNPQDKMKIIHVAGTNGKGSTCMFLSSILREAGYRVGLYTSPYLEEFNERIRIDGENVTDEEVAICTTTVRKAIEELVEEGYPHPTEFEVTTAMGFLCFERAKVDFLVLEVGMGGRFDATNVITSPVMTIITPVGMDHVQYLGDTLKKIAYEKAGILKENVPLVLYPQQREVKEEILRVAKEKKVPVVEVLSEKIEIISTSLEGQTVDMEVLGHRLPKIKLFMIGEHQAYNAMTAITAILWLHENDKIEMDEHSLREGISKTRWAGRLEVMSKQPVTIIDGAHNEDGAKVLVKMWKALLSEYEITLVFGMLQDKDIEQVSDLLMPHVKQVITVAPNSDRAMSAEELAAKLQKYDKRVEVSTSIREAIERAEQMTDLRSGAIVYAGSLYMIGEVRKILRKKS